MVTTEYGQYRFNLGPGINNEYHEISFVGMDDFTTVLKKYDLSTLNVKYRSACYDLKGNYPLPEFTGGSRVHLLLGIKNTNLDFLYIMMLPSGIAVYESIFVDIWGSRLIYACPHPPFTENNSGCKQNVTHAVFYTSMENCIQGEQLSFHSLVADECLGLTIHPHPLNDEDFLKLEFMVDNNLEELLGDSFDAKILGIHMATVRSYSQDV